MRTTSQVSPILALLLACGGGAATSGVDTQDTQSEDAPTTTQDESTVAETETTESETTESETDGEGEAPVDHLHANLRLLHAVAAGETPFSEIVNEDEKGLLLVQNHDDADGHLVQNASHFCHRALSRRYPDLIESLLADLTRGEELNDMACNASLEGPERMDCSMGGTEEIPTSHYIFEETEAGLRLEAIYRVSEIGKDERYVSHAFRFIDRQTAQTRRHGCR